MTTDDPTTKETQALLAAKDQQIAELTERLGALGSAARSLRQRYEELKSRPPEGGEVEPDAELRERALALASRLERKGRENQRQKAELEAAREEVLNLTTRLAACEAERQEEGERTRSEREEILNLRALLAECESKRQQEEAERARLARELAEQTALVTARLSLKDEEETKERRDRAAFLAESEALNALVADKDARLAELSAELENRRQRHYELEVEHAALRQNNAQMSGELERSRAECGRLLLLRDELAARLYAVENGSKESELLKRIETLTRERVGLEAALKETQGQLARERATTERLAETTGREAAFAESLAKRDHALSALAKKLAMAIEEGAELAADCAAAREELAFSRRKHDELDRLGERIARRIHIRPMPLSND